MKSNVTKVKVALAAVVWAAILLAASAPFTSIPARAQAGGNAPLTQAVLSAGPISLSSGESALIGLLLPAVQNGLLLPAIQKLQRGAHLVLFNGDGKVLVDVPVAMGDGSVRPAFFTVTFTTATSFTGGIFKIVGPDLKEVSLNGDGKISVVFMPAMQGGNLILPVSSSVQILNSDGNRGQVIGFCDGSV